MATQQRASETTGAVKTKRKVGRPTRYKDQLAAEFCRRISMGKSMRTVCKAVDMPDPRQIFDWMAKYPEFNQQYARACEERSEALIEETLDIADDATNDWMEVENQDGSSYEKLNREAIERSKLRIETRKWMASKLKPKKYGDKVDITSDGKQLPAPITALQINVANSETLQKLNLPEQTQP